MCWCGAVLDLSLSDHLQKLQPRFAVCRSSKQLAGAASWLAGRGRRWTSWAAVMAPLCTDTGWAEQTDNWKINLSKRLLELIILFRVTSQVFVDEDFHKSVMSSACTKVSFSPLILNSCALFYPVILNYSNPCSAFFLFLSVYSGECGPECSRPHQCPNAGL